MRAPGRTLVVLTTAVLALIWGTTWAAIRIGLRGVPPFTGVSLRFALAAVTVLLVAPLLGGRFEGSRREKALWVVNGLLSFCASYGILYWAEQWVPSGLASVLFATFPFFVAILAHFALPEEPLRAGTLVGTTLGFLGVAAIFSEDFAKIGGPGVAFAAAVLLLAPFVSAVSNVAIKKWGRGLHPLSLTAVPMGIAAGVMGGVAALTERGRTFEWDATSIGAIAYLAIPGSAVTFTLYYWLLQHLPATRVALIAYLSPVVAVTVGAIFLDEPYTGRMLAGTGLVLAGVALANRAPRRVAAKAAGAAVVWACVGLSAHAEAPPPIVLPSDEPPPAIRTLTTLADFDHFAIKDDLSLAAAARTPGTPPKSGATRKSILVVSAGNAVLRTVELDGEARALRFGPGDGALYVLVGKRRRKDDPGEAFLQRFDPASANRPVAVRVPGSAADMDLSSDGTALLVACRNEIRVVTIPDLRSPRLFRVVGDNRAVAAIPGGSRVVLGQSDALVVVNLADQQGPEGLTFLERIAVHAPVANVVSAPDGSALLARLSDGRTLDVRVDPIRVEPRSVSSTVLWPGRRIDWVATISAGVPPLPPPQSMPVAPPSTASAGSGPGADDDHVDAPSESSPSNPPDPASDPAGSRAPGVANAVVPPPDPAQAASAPRVDEHHVEGVAGAAAEAAPPSSDAARASSQPVPDAAPASPQPDPGVATAPPSAPPAHSSPAPESGAQRLSDVPPGFVRGRLSGAAAAQVSFVVLFGPDNVLREAQRVAPESDGSWSAGPLAPGAYRVTLDAGGRKSVVSDPPFLRIFVEEGRGASAPDMTVVRVVGP